MPTRFLKRRSRLLDSPTLPQPQALQRRPRLQIWCCADQPVFNNTRQVSKNGGNNVWERGIVHPEEVLADLIKIFHPDLLPEHELIYFENLQ